MTAAWGGRHGDTADGDTAADDRAADDRAADDRAADDRAADDRAADDRDIGWGDRPEDDDERITRERPPHW